MVPNFLIIGADRSGTSFLKLCCREHPEVYIGQVKGEMYYPGDPHFFDLCSGDRVCNYKRGFDWYHGLFDAVSEEVAVGEKTADYLADPEAPKLIHRYLGGSIRLIAILRNPIDRAYSRFWHQKVNWPVGVGFREACQRYRQQLIEPGFYYRNLQRYLRFFDRSQFLILLHDDLRSTPLQVVQEMYSFLGVNNSFVPDVVSEGKVNTAIGSGVPYYLKMGGAVVKRYSPGLFRFLKNSPGANWVKDIIKTARGLKAAKDEKKTTQKTGRTYPEMNPRDRRWLKSVYREDVKKLNRFLDRDVLSLWSWEDGM